VRHCVKILATTVALAALFEGAAARSASRPQWPTYVDPPFEIPLPRQPCFSRDDCDREAFDESGTRGRMGLGADPAHPEGPGNFSD
jgi:hypothetical protein